MTKILRFDKTKDMWVYDGLLTADKKLEVDEIINTIKKDIPEIEKELNAAYGSNVMNKYNLGLILDDYVRRYDLNIKDRRMFWIEIGKLASTEKHTRTENNTSQRNYYEECYALSKYDFQTVQKLSWRQWQSLLDRTDEYDERLFMWIKDNPNKIKEEEWRQFLKIHHNYLKDKDSNVFDDDEVSKLYDSFMSIAENWIINKKKFVKDNPKSSKAKNIDKKQLKYIEKCFCKRRESMDKIITKEMCDDSFNELVE